jgi:hypothetical protein
MVAVVLAQAVRHTQPEALSVHVARLKPEERWLPASQLYDLTKMERMELTRGLLSQAAAEATGEFIPCTEHDAEVRPPPAGHTPRTRRSAPASGAASTLKSGNRPPQAGADAELPASAKVDRASIGPDALPSKPLPVRIVRRVRGGILPLPLVYAVQVRRGLRVQVHGCSGRPLRPRRPRRGCFPQHGIRS